jgi:hypothetical protein
MVSNIVGARPRMPARLSNTFIPVSESFAGKKKFNGGPPCDIAVAGNVICADG